MANIVPYVSQSWVDGVSQASAARMGVIEAGVSTAHYMPAVRVTHNAAQSIANATDTALAFNTERFDQAGNAADTMHDTVTNNSRLTCRYAGIYQITANVEWPSNSTGVRDLKIRLGGTTVIAYSRMINTATVANMICTTLYSLAVNEYVEAVVFQNSTVALNVNSTANHSPEFMMIRVG